MSEEATEEVTWTYTNEDGSRIAVEYSNAR